MTRLRRLGLAVLATAALAILGVAAPAQACACGAFVAPDGEDIAISAEYAVLGWDGETERVVLSVDALTSADDAALLIPTPTPAQAALADEDLFAELSDYIAPEVVVEYRWWPEGYGFGFGAGDGAPAGGSVELLDTQQLGPLEVSVLSAEDADELANWLDDHGYVMGDGVADALTPYVAEGWYYVAIRLTTDAEDLSGALQPIDLTFASDQLIYPMRMSMASDVDQFVRTYVFADQQVQRTDETAINGNVDLRFAGEVEVTSLTSQALVEIASAQPYLTVFDQYFGEPATEIVSDFTFAAAATNSPHREVVVVEEMREIAGLPAGPVLTFAGMVGFLAVVLTLSGLARRRRRRRLYPEAAPATP